MCKEDVKKGGYDKFDDRIVERLVLHMPCLFDELEQMVDERVIEHA